MTLAPLILFVYNRPTHTRLTVEALLKNNLAPETDLYVYSDAAKNNSSNEKVEEVRAFIHQISGFKSITIIERQENMGLANSIISGVTEVIQKYKRVIVLEDDLLTSTDFLEYMNEALNVYEARPAIWSISGYQYPFGIPGNYPHDVYLSKRPHSWGWATWEDRWSKSNWNVLPDDPVFKNNTLKKAFNEGGEDLTRMLWSQVNGEIDSWYVRWAYSQFQNNCYSVFPVQSKVKNIGVDGSGTHFKHANNKYQTEISHYKVNFPEHIEPNEEFFKLLQRFMRKPFYQKAVRWVLLKTGLYNTVANLWNKIT